jgi:hypothetical protein
MSLSLNKSIENFDFIFFLKEHFYQIHSAMPLSEDAL